MTEQRSGQQWIIKVNGAEQTDVKPGESIEIGRKPLRPLADDGNRRLEVPDSERSMSKRHALFTVHEDGSADVRDLNSTNGSYMIRENGELTRLQPGVECELKYSPIRLQFGDIPVDFIRVDAQERVEPKVTDLFSYAPDDAKQEPDPSDMSVDDILNLRAGEPTAMFSSQNVADRLRELRDASLHVPKLAGTEPEQPVDENVSDNQRQAQPGQETAQEQASPAGHTVAGAVAGQRDSVSRQSASGAMPVQRGTSPARAFGTQPILPDPVVTVTQQRHFAEQHPLEELPLTVQPGGMNEPGPRDLFADAEKRSKQENQAKQQPSESDAGSSASGQDRAEAVGGQHQAESETTQGDSAGNMPSDIANGGSVASEQSEAPASNPSKPDVVSVHDLFSAQRIHEVQAARAASDRDTQRQPVNAQQPTTEGQQANQSADESLADQSPAHESPASAVQAPAEQIAQAGPDPVVAQQPAQAVQQPIQQAPRVTFTPMEASASQTSAAVQGVPTAQYAPAAQGSQAAQPAQAVPVMQATQPVQSAPQQASQTAESQDYSRFARPAAGQPAAQQPGMQQPQVSADPQQNFKPVFEPGSVFERVSRGDFDKQEQMVQVGGYTSQQAKTTSDYTVQFQIARHAQLLPFLAMNPSLYDDLYTWLAAQGNADVDAALSRNQGYQEYRKAVGK